MMLSHNSSFRQHENLSTLQCDSSVTGVTNTTQVFLDLVRFRETMLSDVTPVTSPSPLFRSGVAAHANESKKLTESSMKFHPSTPHLST